MAKRIAAALTLGVALATALFVSGVPAAAQTVTIRVMSKGTLEEKQIEQAVVKAFEREYPHIKVKYENPGGWGWEKLITLIAGGNAPDVTRFFNGFTPMLAAKGALIDLKPFIDSDKSFDLDDMVSNGLTAASFRDAIYGVPQEYIGYSMAYNAEMFDDAGLNPPPESLKEAGNWTWETLLAVAKKLSKDTNGDGKMDQWGIVYDMPGDRWLPWIYQNGGQMVDNREDPTRYTLDHPRTIEAVQWLMDLRFVHKATPTPDEMKGIPEQFFTSGQVGMYPFGPWLAPHYQKFAKFDWNIGHLPAGKGGRWNSAVADVWTVVKGSKHPREAWEFVKFMTGPVGQSMKAVKGNVTPSRQSAFNVLLNAPGKPQNKRVLIEAATYAKVPEKTPFFFRVQEVLNRELWLVLSGKKNVENAMKTANVDANNIMAEGKF